MFSFLIGCLIGIPVSLYAVNHREPATIPVYYDPGLFTQFSEQPEQPTAPEAAQLDTEPQPIELDPETLELFARCVEAEAGNQGLYGKQLVADVILNRVDSPDFPDTISDVIMQKYHFSVVWDGRIWEVEPTEETYQAIQTELEARQNTEILFFTAEGFSRYGKAWQKVGDHYFSTGRGETSDS